LYVTILFENVLNVISSQDHYAISVSVNEQEEEVGSGQETL